MSVDLNRNVVDGIDIASAETEEALKQVKADLEQLERVTVLAEKVQTVQAGYKTSETARLPNAFGQYLAEAGIETANLALLEQTLDAAESALDANESHPTYPFEQVVSELCASVASGDITTQKVTQAVNVVDDATTVLEFLDSVDTSHSSINLDEWRESVRTALKQVFPDLISPLVTSVDKMGETLWQREHLYYFSWQEFEELVASLYESRGYETRVTQGASDEGVDIWARDGRSDIAIQVKQFGHNNRVGRPTLQKLASTIAKGDADQAIVVTSGEFANTAEEYAQEFGPKMTLVDGTELVRMLTESDIQAPVTDQS